MREGGTCGDFGGQTKDGEPCSRPAGFGADAGEGPCYQHVQRQPTARERVFADEWLKDMNASRAFRVIAEPGSPPTPTTATSQGHDILHRPHVQRYIQNRLEAIFADLEDQQRAVIGRLFEIATGDLGTLMDGEWMRLRSLDDLPPGGTRLVKRIKETRHGLDIQLHDPMAAIKMLGQYWDLFTDRVEVTGRDGGPIEHREVTDDELRRRLSSVQNRVALLTGAKASGNGGPPTTNAAKANGKNGRHR